MTRILAIGNSFSQDATAFLQAMADSAGVEADIVNLYIGGCSLQMHAENIAQDAAAYSYERNGTGTGRMVSIREALEEGPWDVVTVQQVSGLSGVPESYEPWGREVLDCVRTYAPGAKIWFHRTWAYEIDSEHGDFPRYGRDQAAMHRAILSASESFARDHGLQIIPVGDVIAALRREAPFRYGQGGESLCRDGFHMSYTHGRYAAALCWFEILLGDCSQVRFVPEGVVQEKIIRETVKEICRERK